MLTLIKFLICKLTDNKPYLIINDLLCDNKTNFGKIINEGLKIK
jgi:hypothetical protein